MKCLFVAMFVFLFAESTLTTPIRFTNGKTLRVEVARTMSERHRGLMHRTSLAPDQGMLFVFRYSQKLSFWNKNTFIPLSIAYIDDKKVIKEIHQMKAQSMIERDETVESYPSECLCLYALEVNQGWFAKNKVKVGDKLSFALKQ